MLNMKCGTVTVALVLQLIPLPPAPPGASPLLTDLPKRSTAEQLPAYEAERMAYDVPVVFEPNRGQMNKRIQWMARAPGLTLFITESGLTVQIHGEGAHSGIVGMRLVGGRSWEDGHGLLPTGGISNYFIGDDPARWRTDVPHYRKVKYSNVYAGIDLVLYGSPQIFEYDLVVRPGANPRTIRVAYEGVQRVEVDSVTGDLLVTTHSGAALRHRKPRIYQETAGRKVELAGAYDISANGLVGIDVAMYDVSQELVIDPQIVSTTYVGRSTSDQVQALAVDVTGSAYIAGYTFSGSGYPMVGGFQAVSQGRRDTFVSKFAPDGKTLEYSTYLGGFEDDDAFGIAVDSEGSAYVTGVSASTNFPILNPYQMDQGLADAFVTKLAAKGNAIGYSTYLGGSGIDGARSIAVDDFGNAYVTGRTASVDFPLQSPIQTHQGESDAFVTKVGPAGDTLVFSTYLGGRLADEGRAIAVDGDGSPYVAGWTFSTNFPTRSPYQRFRGRAEAFAAKLTSDGRQISYSTYLGGSGDDYGHAIAVGRDRSAVVAGITSSPDLPTERPFQTQLKGGRSDGFLLRIEPDGARVMYATFLGGSGGDEILSVATDETGSAYVTGFTESKDFPTQEPLQTLQGSRGAFVAKFEPLGNRLVFSTHLGGIRGGWEGRGVSVDSSGTVYVVGRGNFMEQGTVFVTRLRLPPVVFQNGVVNNASYASGAEIAQGSLFAIFGHAMGPGRLEQVGSYPLPAQLAGTGVRVSVAGQELDAYVIYVSAGQVGAILPSRTPLGNGSITVSYHGERSKPIPIRAVRNRFGVFTVNQKGTGQAVVQNVEAASALRLNSPDQPARPGQLVIIWGTGLGPVTGTEEAGPSPGNMDDLSVGVRIGDRNAKVVYVGRSGCCAGIDQLIVEIPEGIEGCRVPLVVEVAGVASNVTTISVSAEGAACPAP